MGQHHPGAASFEASPYRARALRRHPSSAEEGSFYRFLVCALILLFVSIPTVWAQQDLLQQVGIDQKLDAPIDLSLPFRDEAGRTVHLGDFFHGKPVILAPVYFACSSLCPMSLNSLVQSLRVLKFDAGSEFEVVTFSF